MSGRRRKFPRQYVVPELSDAGAEPSESHDQHDDLEWQSANHPDDGDPMAGHHGGPEEHGVNSIEGKRPRVFQHQHSSRILNHPDVEVVQRATQEVQRDQEEVRPVVQQLEVDEQSEPHLDPVDPVVQSMETGSLETGIVETGFVDTSDDDEDNIRANDDEENYDFGDDERDMFVEEGNKYMFTIREFLCCQ